MVIESTGRVLFHDTDAGGVVYFGSYCQFIEKGYSEWFRKYVMPLSELLRQHSLYFLIYDLNIKYLSPLHYDEEFIIKTKLVNMGKTKLFFGFYIYNQKQKLCTEASAEKICYSAKDHAVVKIPDNIVSLIREGLIC